MDNSISFISKSHSLRDISSDEYDIKSQKIDGIIQKKVFFMYYRWFKP